MPSRMAMPEDYEVARRAHAQGKLGVNWGLDGVHGGPSRFASSMGWDLPAFFGIKKAFVKKMLESPESFAAALTSSGIDVYVPDEAR